MDEETRVAMPGNLHPTNFSRLLQTLEIRSDAHDIPERKIAVITFSRGGVERPQCNNSGGDSLVLGI